MSLPVSAGLVALQHAVQGAPPAALRRARYLRQAMLASAVVNAVRGADEAVWAAAAPAACAIVVAVEGATLRDLSYLM